MSTRERILEEKRRAKIRFFEKAVLYAIAAEAFLLPLFPMGATAALIVGVLAWGIRSYLDADFHFRHLPFDVPVGLFVLLSALSVFASPDMGFSFYNYYHLVGAYLFTYLLVGQNIRSMKAARRIVLALAAGAAISVAYGYSQFLFGIDTASMRWVDGEAFPELKKRIFSTWENPNIFAGFLDMAICVVFGLMVSAERKWQAIMFFLIAVLLFACLGMTYARGAFLTVCLIFVIYGAVRDWRIVVGFVFVGAAALYLDPALYGRMISVFTQVDTSSEMRLALWESTLAMIADHPFFGIGWGAYFMVYPEYDFYLQGAPVLIVHAHNLYLNYAAEIGLVGAAAFLWYFFGTMILAFRVHFGAREILPQILGTEEDEASSREEEIRAKEALRALLLKDLKTQETAQGGEADAASAQAASLTAEKTQTTETEEEGRKDANDAKEGNDIANASEAPVAYEVKLEDALAVLAEKEAEEERLAREAERARIEALESSALKASAENRSAQESAKMMEDLEKAPRVVITLQREIFVWEDENLRRALGLGIGLAFVSVALNGITDDLLFNIPTSMLLWMLAALAAALEKMEEEELGE